MKGEINKIKMSDSGSFNGLVYFRGMREIPFFSLDYQHREIHNELTAAFHKVMGAGNFVWGSNVKAFESEFASYQQVQHCVGTGNGHDALLISLKALKIGAGDEVIVPSHTCQATWLAVVNSGAKPVPVEVDETLTIDPTKIENAITSKSKAIVPVHLYGQPCRMDAVMTIAEKNNLFVIEDNAQAHGAKYKRKFTGSFGHINATSFYPTKNLGALGDGGAITTNDEHLYELAKAVSNYGSIKKDDHFTSGINSRLDELQAAFLSIKLKRLEEWNEMRRQNANVYFQNLKNVGDIILPSAPSQASQPVFHLFVIQTAHRDKLKEYLNKEGIGTAIHYPTPVHLQKAYTSLGYSKGSLPIAEKLSETVLSLPVWPGLKIEEIEFVCDKVKLFFA
jgi:dTDP-4-amino-4,6-dideoxygalactose transaminase